MSRDDDVAKLRESLHALERTTATALAHFGDSVDAKRLRLDVQRLSEDVDLLCGAEKVAEQRALEIIEDREYAPDFWQEAEDEGLGAAGRRAP